MVIADVGGFAGGLIHNIQLSAVSYRCSSVLPEI